ncbi:MAG: bleomycin resistance protein [Gammaproteobacteria bacterium]
MAIEPFKRCSDISQSLEFYTRILDFVVVHAPDTDPTAFMSKYSLIERDGCLVHLSSHSGDGVFGNVLYVRVDDVDTLYHRFVANGLNTDERDRYPSLRIQPVEQTWGMKEFSIADPDGNKITFGHQIR